MLEAAAPPTSKAMAWLAWGHRHLVWLSLGGLYLALVATGHTVDAFTWFAAHDPFLRGGQPIPAWVVPPNDLSGGAAGQPWDAWMMSRWRQGDWPMWQPFQGLGSPLWGNGEAAPLNPLKWLAVWAPEGPGYMGFLGLRMAVLWWGFRALGRALGWGLAASDVAAVAFMASAPVVLGFTLLSVHVWCFLPWWLLLAWRWGQAPTLHSALGLGAFTGWMAWMGHAEIALLGAVGVWLSAAAVAWSAGQWRWWWRSSPWALAWALLVGAPMWLPFACFLGESTSYILDSPEFAATAIRSKTHLWVALKCLVYGLFNPFGGPIEQYFNANAGLMALAAGLWAWWWQPSLRPLMGAAWLWLLAGLLLFEPTTPWALLKPSPASHYQMVWASWALALALGGCWQALLAQPERLRRWLWSQAGLGLVAVGLAWKKGATAWLWLPVVLAPLGALPWVGWGAQAWPWAMGTQALALVVERGAWGALNLTPVPRHPLPELTPTEGFPGLGPDFRMVSDDGLQGAAVFAYGMRGVAFYEAFFPSRWVAYSQLMGLKHLSVILAPEGEHRSGPWLDLAAVGHRLVRPERPGGAWRWVARPRALARARWVGEVEATSEALGAQGQRLALAPERWRTQALVELAPGDPDREWGGKGPVGGPIRWLQDEPNALAWEVEAPQAQWLVVADQWASGWSCTLDGKPWRMHPAYLTMRAVPIPAGRHVVGMRYEAPGLRLGLLLAALGLAIALAVVAWGRVRPRSLGVT